MSRATRLVRSRTFFLFMSKQYIQPEQLGHECYEDYLRSGPAALSEAARTIAVLEAVKRQIFSRLEKRSPDMLRDIADFHEKFGLSYEGSPRALSPKLLEFRTKFLEEELAEFKRSRTIEDQFDALIDLVYVALGTAYLMGLPFDKGWDEVHKTNMAKCRVKKLSNSKRLSPYDVVKPKDWVPPDLKSIIKRRKEELSDESDDNS